MARKDKNGVYWMNVHDAAKEFMKAGVPWDTHKVLDMITLGRINTAHEQRIDGRIRHRISSTEIARVVADELSHNR